MVTYMDTFDALADPTRRAILELLAPGGQSVGDIARHFPVSRPAISKHLRILKEAGLVVEVKQGRQRIYSAILTPLNEVRRWVDGLGSETGQRAMGKRAAREAKRRPSGRAGKRVRKPKQPKPTPKSEEEPKKWKVW